MCAAAKPWLTLHTTLSVGLVEHRGQVEQRQVHPNHHNADGFNLQELSTRLRGGISAFQDRISDFTVSGEDVGQNPVKPHEWAFLSDSSITINLTRTADSGNAIWTM